MLAEVSRLPGVEIVVSPYSATGARQLNAADNTAYASVTMLKGSDTDAVVAVAEKIHSSAVDVQVGGAAFTKQPGGGATEGLGIIVAFLILLLVFRSIWGAVLPIITGVVGVSFIVAPMPMLRVFTDDPNLLSIGVRLLLIAAAFQLFDGPQAVATGVLRGVGDTRTPMVMNVVGHWVLGFPVGWALCFRYGWGVIGLWVGLSIGLTFVAVVLTVAWRRKSRNLALPATPALVAP